MIYKVKRFNTGTNNVNNNNIKINTSEVSKFGTAMDKIINTAAQGSSNSQIIK